MTTHSKIPHFGSELVPTMIGTRAHRDLVAALDDGDSASGDSAAV
ncbi:hypothetical protein [Corynebacterium amycolatum]|nr:hypothetical protein [Corynebacterium amycolatum]EEB62457.1 hypothetical protein CORAM0001_1566 [Corynebacterium amycolatum SK46]